MTHQMSLVADIAQAAGVTQRTVRDELNRGALADAILELILARFWPRVTPESIAEVAGVTKEELSSAIVRYHDHHTREQRATVAAYKTVTRKRHVPVGEPPSPAHQWCKRGSHWCHADDMGRNSARPDGLGDWCRACWREYWQSKVAAKRAAKPAPVDVEEPARKRRRPRLAGPTCRECSTLMISIDGRPRCVNELCSIGARNRRRYKRSATRPGTAAPARSSSRASCGSA